MRQGLLLQTAALLIIGQAIFGLIGYLTRNLPWAGLLLTVLFVWFVVRTATVVRSELPRRDSVKGKSAPFPWSLVGAALLWQAPTLVAVPLWMPDWAGQVWQGAVWPIPLTLGLWWAAIPSALASWFWAVAVLEMFLFAWVAGRPEPSLKLKPRAVAQVAAARMVGTDTSQWSPAKRFQPGTGKRRPDLFGHVEEEPEQE